MLIGVAITSSEGARERLRDQASCLGPNQRDAAEPAMEAISLEE